MCKENKTAQIRSPCLPNRQLPCPYTCPEFWRIDEPSLQEMYWAGIFGHVDGIIVMKRTWGKFGYVIKGGNTIRPFTVSKTSGFLTTKCPYLNTLGQWQRKLTKHTSRFFFQLYSTLATQKSLSSWGKCGKVPVLGVLLKYFFKTVERNKSKYK